MNIHSTVLASLTIAGAFATGMPTAYANCDYLLAACLAECTDPLSPCAADCYRQDRDCRIFEELLPPLTIARPWWDPDVCLSCPPEAIFEIDTTPWESIFELEIFAIPHEVFPDIQHGTLLEPGMFVEDLASQITELQVLHFSHETGQLQELSVLAMGESERGGLIVTIGGEALGVGELFIMSNEAVAGGLLAFGPAAN